MSGCHGELHRAASLSGVRGLLEKPFQLALFERTVWSVLTG
jgi:hypothetical protein